MRNRSLRVAAGLAGLGIAGAALAPAAQAAPRCQSVLPAVAKENAAAGRLVRRLISTTAFTPVERTVTPKITRTVGFVGYGSIVVPAPRGTTPVVGSFRLRGADRCAITITAAQVVLRRNAYVIDFIAPGEQGDPGRVTVTLISV
ncbi:hypothetical protein Q5424_24855 [Conexibacter sp. JD483]|uniref:hypothetical protein n=1 Tax=unclassified Conexibacter TaxID=2627773 RepID=UPI00271B939C|nr:MULTISPECIES: hypothetical protein [unclassified Conexibacter]MDO8188432.1 hypothetical protein [Conexibacter sp. CPCC 205706]MDO8199207.1 hypothetical protein [Conexibacter sp. CPCC 205762]MDR9372351.1 hypothetical protein [Conexibacter sp. JD483]